MYQTWDLAVKSVEKKWTKKTLNSGNLGLIGRGVQLRARVKWLRQGVESKAVETKRTKPWNVL